MSDFPAFLKSGEIARLIPVIADSRKEQRVTSVFLAALSAIPNLAEALLSSLGQKMGKKTTINSFTEVVFKEQSSDSRDRPDGLLIVDRRQSKWSALIEAKIGNNAIDAEQVDRYAQLARSNSIDAVITISNEFVARPDHSPVTIPKPLLRKIKLYHWSWKFIVTEAVLLQSRATVTDPDKAFLLREFIRFLSHDSIGVTGFTQMPPEWKAVAAQVQSGATLRKTSSEVSAVVDAWHQEIRDLALRMSHHLSVNVQLRLTKIHASDPDIHLKDGCSQLSDKQILTAILQVPDAASDIDIVADVKARSIRVGMEIAAPRDKQRTSARVNWLLRQIKNAIPTNLFVRIVWPGRAEDTVCSVEALRDELDRVCGNIPHVPRSFEVFFVTADSRRFIGRKTFIEELENTLPTFYENVGQHLQTWRPKPPKPAKTTEELEVADVKQAETSVPELPVSEPQPTPSAGNLHTALLEIPPFLKRAY